MDDLSQSDEAVAEQESLLEDDENFNQWADERPCPPNPYLHLPVYNTIHRVRHDVVTCIDDPYSREQLRSPRMNLSTVRPLVDRLYELKDVSISE